jgi:hypothetical protein
MAKREQRLKAVRRLEDVEIINQNPCDARWQDMRGDDRVRHCFYCNLNVYNFAGLSPAEIFQIIQTHEGRLCAQFYARADGTMTLEDCDRQEQALLRGRLVIQPREP